MNRVPAILLLVAAASAGCGKDEPAGAPRAAVPVEAKVTPEGPVGLYLMTRFLQRGTPEDLEKGAWYFAPDGTVYENLRTGFSSEDLAAHAGRRGRRTMKDGTMTVSWAGGRSTTTRLSPDRGKGPGFGWDLAAFRPARPFEGGRSYAGTWDDGDPASGETLVLRADGTYESSGAAGPASSGTWKAAGYSLTLKDAAGKATRRIAFPVDDATLYYAGRTLRRR